MAADGLERLLDALGIEEGDLVFLHTTYSRLQRYAESPQQLIETLLRRLGSGGTLAMPRYAWHLDPTARPWKGYGEYLRSRPPMDLRFTPANIGIVPEVFRKLTGVKVSLSHCWPVSALGRLSEDLVADQASIGHAFGAASCFGRLLSLNAKVLGLGVTLNTSSIAPVTDHLLGMGHRHDIFTSRPVPGMVIDLQADIHHTHVVTMRPECVRDFRPSRILDGVLKPGSDFPFVESDGSFFFCYPAKLYHEAALAAGREALLRGRAVPWIGDGENHP